MLCKFVTAQDIYTVIEPFTDLGLASQYQVLLWTPRTKGGAQEEEKHKQA